MARFDVDGKVVQGVDLLKRRHWTWRLDVWPFAILYSIWLFVAVPSLDFTDALIVLGALAVAHILVLLFTAWSVDFRCFVQFGKAKDIYSADACKVTPAKFSGAKEIVPLHIRRPVEGSSASSTGNSDEIYFDFRKQRFIFSTEKETFCKLTYPTKESFGYYLRNTGHGSEAKVAAATNKWGRNVFEYPQPTFQKLMKENCTEPFFVFQVFCVGLWCLDEYWYYSLFTLFMLFLFESTMAKSRLKTLTELRRVRVDGQTLMVHRCGKWVKLSGTDLLPGDVVSVGRSSGQSGEEKAVPGDMLLLAGSAIVNEAILTGESTPQWKVSIAGEGFDDKLSIKRDKSHILFGGTKILQHTPDKSFNLKTPDGGCLAVVLRTGFETSQGKLMRTILFSTERVTANSWESGFFILFLVFFAIIAAGYVLKKGLEDPTRSKYKLFLSCSLIITSVIPPELPMELSIAVNTSLIALARRGIFCTEPFRIPFAGKVDICCFDKTGTLTSDDMEFQGVAGLADNTNLESDTTKLPASTVEVLAACHALVFVDNKLVGDPLERAALKGIDWIYTSDEKAMPKRSGGHAVQIVKRHHFASHLKRMAVVVRVQEQFLAYVKGAPETIQDRLIEMPPTYVETYKKYTRQGSRVLALAYKPLPEMAVSEARSLDRDLVESGLTFAGFAVFNCPIRPDSGSVLCELKGSSHDLVMITGDQALTACHVASQVHIISKPALILARKETGEGFEWVSPDETDITPYSENEVEELSDSHDLCIGGDCFEMLQRTEAVLKVIPYIKVFARVAPEQKELILTTFKTVGRMTLMCGDGTNDVGALKQAHVGIALLNAVPPSQTGDSSSQTSKLESKSGKLKKPKPMTESSHSAAPPNSSVGTPNNRHLSAADKQRQKLKKMLDEMNEEGDGRAAPIVKLGDASMASPFTAKHASVAPTLDIIRQGRSTLVTTLQMFKILGLNCLATAYVLSVMYLDGVKLGDIQATISGVFTAAFFLFISHARPLQTLSAARPHPNIFCAYVLLSLLGQFAIHLFFLISAVNEASKHMPEECIEPDSDFHPNLVNTVSYMVNMMIQVATFAVNYMGHPFNQSISENKPFRYALFAAVGFFTVITSDLFRDLNDWLKLEPLPDGMRDKLMLWAALMFLGCYGWERLLRWAFPGKMPAWKRRQKQATAALEKKRL
ncbi:probable manganese-transporting ATPase PDR2 [Phoenix dactylifera]|uniref:Probable manganese-transporting ATPase PDR2 n=1 Tax=Phoenix dactylifera TaxID=42345 RepID=A0A8B9ASX2_PHODC|nr:probable manganese-transporting ATPase PDR2 [Phoenix dactylifera]XP_038988653.1 probable manganese-transporting ATPase PDR2 [Phoenix dactylifera]